MGRIAALLAAVLLAACGGDEPASHYDGPVTTADIPLLFMGNSHSSLNGLQPMVEELVRAAQPGKTVDAIAAPGWMFLEDRRYDARSLELLRVQGWSFVVLQAQKYSTTHTRTYTIEPAVELVGMARDQGAVPILFPEWPLEGVDETMYIYDIHVSIARRAPACVAPIGQAWDLSRSRHPEIGLYGGDGNHSNANGALLTALILSATMTGASPLDAPTLAVPVDADTQTKLRAVAADTVAAWPPRQHCPDDPY